MAYWQERRAAVPVKMLPPSSMTIAALSRQEGISEKTLYKWRREARAQGRPAPDAGEAPAGWTSRDKFAAVVETASLNVAETAAYCRERGLYPEQIAAWRPTCEGRTTGPGRPRPHRRSGRGARRSGCGRWSASWRARKRRWRRRRRC